MNIIQILLRLRLDFTFTFLNREKTTARIDVPLKARALGDLEDLSRALRELEGNHAAAIDADQNSVTILLQEVQIS